MGQKGFRCAKRTMPVLLYTKKNTTLKVGRSGICFAHFLSTTQLLQKQKTLKPQVPKGRPNRLSLGEIFLPFNFLAGQDGHAYGSLLPLRSKHFRSSFLHQTSLDRWGSWHYRIFGRCSPVLFGGKLLTPQTIIVLTDLDFLDCYLSFGHRNKRSNLGWWTVLHDF